MTAAMLIPSPLASTHPDVVAVTTHVFPEVWARAPLVANVKTVHAQEAGQGEKVRNQMVRNTCIIIGCSNSHL
jgi:hypothetical protein